MVRGISVQKIEKSKKKVKICQNGDASNSSTRSNFSKLRPPPFFPRAQEFQTRNFFQIPVFCWRVRNGNIKISLRVNASAFYSQLPPKMFD